VQQDADVVGRAADDVCHIDRRELLHLPQLKYLALLRGQGLETVAQHLARLT
jgi:hypothetical protein